MQQWSVKNVLFSIEPAFVRYYKTSETERGNTFCVVLVRKLSSQSNLEQMKSSMLGDSWSCHDNFHIRAFQNALKRVTLWSELVRENASQIPVLEDILKNESIINEWWRAYGSILYREVIGVLGRQIEMWPKEENMRILNGGERKSVSSNIYTRF